MDNTELLNTLTDWLEKNHPDIAVDAWRDLASRAIEEHQKTSLALATTREELVRVEAANKALLGELKNLRLEMTNLRDRSTAVSV